MSAGNLPMLVLRALLTKSGWSRFSSLVQVDSFESNEYRRIYQHIERLHGTTDADLTLGLLRADIDLLYIQKNDLREELNLVLNRLATQDAVPPDGLEVLVRKFLERSAAWNIAEYVSNNADKPEFSINALVDLGQRAVEISSKVNQTVVSVFESPLSGSPDSRRIANSLGVSRQLDASLRGGVAGGELLLYLAGPSVGKTSYLCRTGAAFAERGRNVFHVTLEINSRKVFNSYDRAWTSRTTDELETPQGQEACKSARASIRAAGGHVWVADWSYLGISANDVGAQFRQLSASRCGDGLLGPPEKDCDCGLPRRADMIVIDYLELMQPNKIPGKEMRQAFKMIGQDVRSLARNLDIPICSAWQVNRAGSDAMLLSKKDVSESWDIVKIADIIVGLNQTDEQLRNRILVANIIKQRESTSRDMFELVSDLERMIVRDATVNNSKGIANVGSVPSQG